jgi:ABC-type multidrug transport system fused ATPase/permease subunit
MKDISVPFSLFDFFAVLLPGAAGLFGLYLLLNPALTAAEHDAIFSKIVVDKVTSDFALITTLVLASYLMGLVLNALSELLIDRPANRLRGAHIARDLRHYNVKKAVQQTFGDDILKQSHRRTFTMIESTVRTHSPETAASADKYIALAVMFQSLALVLFVIEVALVKGTATEAIFAGSLVSFAITATLLLLLILLMLWSYRRYKRMWSQAMCMSFVAWASLEKGAEENTSNKDRRGASEGSKRKA